MNETILSLLVKLSRNFNLCYRGNMFFLNRFVGTKFLPYFSIVERDGIKENQLIAFSPICLLFWVLIYLFILLQELIILH